LTDGLKGEGFLWQKATCDKPWVHHYDPENKRHTAKLCYKGSPGPKKFKTKASAGKAILTVFWNYKDVVLPDLLQKGATVTSEHYI
jgi:hypothetical protein